MKKLLIGLLVCALAGVAYGVPAFTINGGAPIEMLPGVPVTVSVEATGVTASNGMTLNLETTPFDGDTFEGTFSITNLVIDDYDAAGAAAPGNPDTVFTSNTSVASIAYMGRPTPDGPVPNFLAIGAVTTAGGNIVANPGIVGWVTLITNAPEGTQGMITTDSSVLSGSAMFTGVNGDSLGLLQGSAPLLVVPEPMTGLLLLVGLPLLRRRRA